ncbi:MAG TPA: TetR/AcrR family transcriptional regulator [Nannocystaceae bacterium]|nr:TetR/AcrR family transcriptional regulator [Nannocystaceae bacterium]
MAETRDALLRAGAELFAARGLDGPSLDDICAAAGKTRGAFYVHFEDRDAFLVAVMERIGLPLLDEIFAGATNLATVASRFLSAAATGAYPLTRKGGVRPHQLIDACMRSPAIRARYVGLVRDAIDRLAAIVANDVAPAHAREVATFLLAAVIGAQTMLELGVPIDLPRTGASLLTLLGETA